MNTKKVLSLLNKIGIKKELPKKYVKADGLFYPIQLFKDRSKMFFFIEEYLIVLTPKSLNYNLNKEFFIKENTFHKIKICNYKKYHCGLVFGYENINIQVNNENSDGLFIYIINYTKEDTGYFDIKDYLIYEDTKLLFPPNHPIKPKLGEKTKLKSNILSNEDIEENEEIIDLGILSYSTFKLMDLKDIPKTKRIRNLEIIKNP